MLDKLSQELEGVGLSEKESRVYLAALEIGPSTAQTIAAKATVNRPTTYIAIESLVQKGLMGSIVKGKKRFFVSEPPEKIYSMLEEEKRDIDLREKLVSRIMDDLKVLSVGSKGHPDVLLFEDARGIERLWENFQKSKSILMEEFWSLDAADGQFPSTGHDRYRHSALQKKTIRSIYASQSGTVLPESDDGQRIERRRIPYGEYPFDGDIAICGDLVGIINYRPKVMGVTIHHEIMANTFHQMFRMAWEGLDGADDGKK